MNIKPLTQDSFTEAIELLKKNNLPTQDINNATRLFALYNNNQLTGIVGIEVYDSAGLIRSLCVDNAKRSAGIGSKLVEYIEEYAKKQQINNLYLLTTTAAPFFSKRKYQIISRNEVPEAVKNSSEFSFVCPSSATVMKKEL